jgi:hypothetical protein
LPIEAWIHHERGHRDDVGLLGYPNISIDPITKWNIYSEHTINGKKPSKVWNLPQQRYMFENTSLAWKDLVEDNN